METYPHLLQTLLDATDVRALAEFYRQLLGLTYRPGDEAPSPPMATSRLTMTTQTGSC